MLHALPRRPFGALGLVLAGAAALSLVAAAPAETGAPEGAPSAEPALEAPAAPTETWWNQEWARIVSLDGSWSCRSAGGTVVFEPREVGSRLEILARLTGRLHTYTFAEGGQVAVLQGWIQVRTEGTLHALAPVADGLLPEGRRGGLGGTRIAQREVECLEWFGQHDWRRGRTPGTNGALMLALRLPAPVAAPALVAHLVDGDNYALPKEGKHTLLTLRQAPDPTREGPGEHFRLRLESSP